MRHKWSLIIPLLIGGCAIPSTAPPPVAADSHKAVIIAVRPIAPAPAILAAIGTTGRAALPDPQSYSSVKREFILRTEDGRVVSVVQDGADRLHLGDSVSIIGGDHARLDGG